MTRRTVLAAVLTVLTIAAAATVWHHLPVNTTIYGPFDVHATINSRADGQNLSATVTGAGLAPTVSSQYSSKAIPAVGSWVVVATALDTAHSPVFPHADLLVGPNRYEPSDRLLSTNELVQPGITLHCAWIFDVPAELLKTVPSVVLRLWGADERLDSRLVIDIPLDDPSVDRLHSIVIPPADLVAS